MDDFDDLELYYEKRREIEEKIEVGCDEEENEDENEGEDEDMVEVEEAEEEQAKHDPNEAVEVKKKFPAKRKLVQNPRLTLNLDRIKQPNGISALTHLLKDVKFQGKNYEKEDLNKVMQIMEQWAHRLMPKIKFVDFIEKLEQLGSKKEARNYLNKIRNDSAWKINAEDFDSSVDEINDDINDQDDQELIASTGVTAEQAFDAIMEKERASKNSSNHFTNKSVVQSSLTEEQRKMINEKAKKAAERRRELALQRSRQNIESNNVVNDISFSTMIQNNQDSYSQELEMTELSSNKEKVYDKKCLDGDQTSLDEKIEKSLEQISDDESMNVDQFLNDLNQDENSD